MKLYRQIYVWSRLADSRLVRYRCLKVLPDDTYCVQSADFFTAPVTETQIMQSDMQFYELLAEEAPEDRTEPAATLEEAIRRHQEAFCGLEVSARKQNDSSGSESGS